MLPLALRILSHEPPVADNFFKSKYTNLASTLSEKIAQSTVYLHLRQLCVFLHFTAMHKVCVFLHFTAMHKVS